MHLLHNKITCQKVVRLDMFQGNGLSCLLCLLGIKKTISTHVGFLFCQFQEKKTTRPLAHTQSNSTTSIQLQIGISMAQEYILFQTGLELC
jgi:hypothetical protein